MSFFQFYFFYQLVFLGHCRDVHSFFWRGGQIFSFSELEITILELQCSCSAIGWMLHHFQDRFQAKEGHKVGFKKKIKLLCLFLVHTYILCSITKREKFVKLHFSKWNDIFTITYYVLSKTEQYQSNIILFWIVHLYVIIYLIAKEIKAILYLLARYIAYSILSGE